MPESELYKKMKYLPTEQINKSTEDIDVIPLLDLLYKINDEDMKVAPAVREQIPNIEKAVSFVIIFDLCVFYIIHFPPLEN